MIRAFDEKIAAKITTKGTRNVNLRMWGIKLRIRGNSGKGTLWDSLQQQPLQYNLSNILTGMNYHLAPNHQQLTFHRQILSFSKVYLCFREILFSGNLSGIYFRQQYITIHYSPAYNDSIAWKHSWREKHFKVSQDILSGTTPMIKQLTSLKID